MNQKQARYNPILNTSIFNIQDTQQTTVISFPPHQSNEIVKELKQAISLNSIRENLYTQVRQKLHIELPKDSFSQFLHQINSNILENNFLIIKELEPKNNAICQELLSSIPMKLRVNYDNLDKKKLNDELVALQSRTREFLELEDVAILQQSTEIQEIYQTYRNAIKRYRTDLIPDHFRIKKLNEAKQLNLNFAITRYSQVIEEIINNLHKDIQGINQTIDEGFNDDSFILTLVNDQNQPVNLTNFNINQFINNKDKHYIVQIAPDHNKETYAQALKLFTSLNKFDSRFIISKNYFIKLVHLYLQTKQDKELNCFKQRLFILFRRYSTFNGSQFVYSKELKPKIYEGVQFQISLPPLLYQQFIKLGIQQELCSSPFNTYLTNYYSLFDDIDCFFNSNGNIFTQNIKNVPTVAFLPNNIDFQLAVLEKLKILKFCFIFYFQNDNQKFDEQIKSHASFYNVLSPQTYWLVSGDSFRPNSIFYQQYQYPLVCALFSDSDNVQNVNFIESVLTNVDGMQIKNDEK